MNDQQGDSSQPRKTGQTNGADEPGFFARVNPFRKKNNGDNSVRDTLEELLEEREEQEIPLEAEEAQLLKNIFGLRERTIEDVCVPRPDICAVAVDSPLDEVVDLMTREGHSRIPVYGEDLDDPIGMVHIKDVIAWQSKDIPFSLAKVCRKVLFVSPSARVLELLLEMRTKRVHMALMVDEYGGTDGIVTIEDLVEEIVGEIEDEHDRPEGPMYVEREDGAIDADARWELDDVEEKIGIFLQEEEREDIDTLGGLVFSIADHVPIRGEVITHDHSGLEFEILEADPRRIHRLRIQNLKVLKKAE
ncbi:Magnesium and cobalt efflux protein CorC [Candidatus Terasakiella magnetica]|uniref:Magnesium and cobalt efflux protein CorC n=1 Tax=Candidatus Terasakiella magnetica TaxID=1867952 RepID=A0A1C3RF16_9PROT|nr:hemolysin family protein [Candidatus Terasakiella magnetica]SCA55870.1 Magnesium and cobalt efflux protein CorC [Candidatus Terasakiella magnetica]